METEGTGSTKLNDCICNKLTDSNGNCVLECPEGEFVIKENTCGPCQGDKPYINSSGDDCTASCHVHEYVS